MSIFGRNSSGGRQKMIEMVLDHDGQCWTLSDASVQISAPTLEELDRKLEKALAGKFADGESISVFMSCNNEVIPMWMRPYMNHYFNRILELPLRYQT